MALHSETARPANPPPQWRRGPVVAGGLGVGLVAGGMPSASAVAGVVLYRLISFGFIIGAGWLVWPAIRARHRRHPSLA